MTGMLALLGGREHHPGCEAIDRAVLAAVPTSTPRVAIVPMASSLRTRARTVGRAVGWWEHLGADPLVTSPDPATAQHQLDVADVIVLTGGVPDRLERRLCDTAIGEHVVARWRDGAGLIGSSSGAMILAAWRQTVRPPFAVRAGLGLLPDTAVAPHHDLTVPRLVAAARARTHPHLTIVGIDDMTALVGRHGSFDVRGVGGVTVRRGTWQRHYTQGARVDLAVDEGTAANRASAEAHARPDQRPSPIHVLHPHTDLVRSGGGPPRDRVARGG